MHHLLPLLKAIADETRLKLLHLLLTQDLCGRALARRLGISEAAVSQHIKILRGAGLVSGEKRGYWTHYAVSKERLEHIGAELAGILKQAGPPLALCRPVDKNGADLLEKEKKRMCCRSCCGKPDLRGKELEECRPGRIRAGHGDGADRDEGEGAVTS